MSETVADYNSDSSDHDLRESIALGEEAKLFLGSKLAQFIINVAEVRVEMAQDELSNVSPTDTSKIIELQGIIKQFDHYQEYLERLVAAGDSAYQLYLNNLEIGS